MNWQYRTILFEFQKDGLLGDRYIDDDEMEQVLNEHGRKGWELVSVTPVQEGLLSFFKRTLQQPRKQAVMKSDESVRPPAKSAGTSARPAPDKPVSGVKASVVSADKQTEKPEPQPDGIGEIRIRS